MYDEVIYLWVQFITAYRFNCYISNTKFYTHENYSMFGTSNFSLLIYVYRKPVLPTVVTVLSREAVRTHTTVGPHVIDTHSIVRTRLSYALVYVWKSSERLSFLVLSYSHLQDILFFTSSKIIMFHIDFSKNFN